MSENRLQEVENLEKQLHVLDQQRTALLAKIENARTAKSEKIQLLGAPAFNKRPETTDEKIELFNKLFVCRSSVYPKFWKNKKGRKGYSPDCKNEWVQGVCFKPKIKCSDCTHQAFYPLDRASILKHLQGIHKIGSYAIESNDTCIFLACDFDDEGWKDDVLIYAKTARSMGIDIAIERSRSGNGAHAWIFFAAPVSAYLARQLGTLILSRAQEYRPQMDFKSYDRFFPNQDFMPKGGFGNLIALPFEKEATKSKNTLFIDHLIQPINDQWGYLANIHRLNLKELESILSKFGAIDKEDQSISPRGYSELLKVDEQLILREPSQKYSAHKNHSFQINIDSQIHISLKAIPPQVISRLKRIATFPNPEFYKLNQMRFPTYPHPRIIFSGEMTSDELLLPRGVLSTLLDKLKKMGFTNVGLKKHYPIVKKLKIRFSGKLSKIQKKAIKEIREYDFGVLVAPPGAGKTVMACQLISQRKVPTLVLVHRQPLISQWKERLLQFTTCPEKNIGIVTGTKKKPSGKIDIASLQTLSRSQYLEGLLPSYGQVLIDECHHIPAVSFESILKKISAQFVLGLTATPYRKDGLEKILYFQCGPIRHQMESIDGESLTKKVLVRETNFKMAESEGEKPPIHVIWHYLIQDKERLSLITHDIKAALKESRFPLVLSDRKEHLKMIYDELCKDKKLRPSMFMLDGSLTTKQRKDRLLKLEGQLAEGRQCCLLATASLIGEGFDFPQLDTLFLTMPISFKGRIVQYAGRLHRVYSGKKEIQIYDYVDTHCRLTLSMYKKRLLAYRSLKYNIIEPPKMIGKTINYLGQSNLGLPI
jgi:superfamily II DNA or RNA helicase